MKKVGFVGGIGPASTVDYYLGFISRSQKKFGEKAYPEFCIDNVNMDKMIGSINDGRYEDTADYLAASVSCLKACGAEIAAITANTPHIAWNYMKDKFEIPVISIVDAAVNEMKRRGFKRVVVMGTVFTMKSGLYEMPMKAAGIEPVIPSDEDKEKIGSLIYPNLENGIIIPEDKKELQEITQKYADSFKADAVLLGCTELPMVIGEGDLSVPVLNTTQIHLDVVFEEACK